MPKLNATVDQIELNTNKINDFDLTQTYDDNLYPTVNGIIKNFQNTNTLIEKNEQSIKDNYELITTINDRFVDYIIEQGTSGIWTYRKWESGFVECWGQRLGAAEITTQWSNLFYTTVNPEVLPFTIYNNNIIVNVENDQGIFLMKTEYKSQGDIGTVWLISPVSLTPAIKFKINYYITGKWKE